MKRRIQEIITSVLNENRWPKKPPHDLILTRFKVGTHTIWHFLESPLCAETQARLDRKLAKAALNPAWFLCTTHPLRSLTQENGWVVVKAPPLHPNEQGALENQVQRLASTLGCGARVECEQLSLYDTIVRSIRFYPSIERGRESVLNHLFCVTGNGYRI